MAREMFVAQHAAAHIVDEKQGRVGRAAGTDRDQAGLRRLAFLAGLGIAGLANQIGESADGSRLEERREPEIHIEALANLGEEPNGEKRVPPGIEAVGLGVDLVESEQALPELREDEVDVVGARGNGVCQRPAFLVARRQRELGRRNIGDFGRAGSEQAAERLESLARGNAGERLDSTVEGGPKWRGLGVDRGKIRDAAQALDGEVLDLGDDLAVFAGDGQVENEQVGTDLGFHPSVAVNPRGEHAINGELFVGEREHQVADLVVAGHEIHRDAGGDIHQRRMEGIVPRLSSGIPRQLERAEALVVAKRDLAQALPMRTEIEVAPLAHVPGRNSFSRPDSAPGSP